MSQVPAGVSPLAGPVPPEFSLNASLSSGSDHAATGPSRVPVWPPPFVCFSARRRQVQAAWGPGGRALARQGQCQRLLTAQGSNLTPAQPGVCLPLPRRTHRAHDVFAWSGCSGGTSSGNHTTCPGSGAVSLALVPKSVLAAEKRPGLRDKSPSGPSQPGTGTSL